MLKWKREITEDAIVLYRPTGPRELELVAQSGYGRWPPRLPEQPIFYPVTNEAYAKEITIKWNVQANGVGFVTRLAVKNNFMSRFQIHKVGSENHTEW